MMFSYYEYINILQIIRESGKCKKFDEAINAEEFIVLRHDVEFSVERAFKMACLEKENCISSTFFFQITNNTYNLFSRRNIEMLKSISEMGHDVGLHFQINGIEDFEKLKNRIIMEMDVLSLMTNIRVDKFSFHRPTARVLEENIKIDNIYNAYQDDFFTYVKNLDVEQPKIKYLSDARHRWNYNLLPTEELMNKTPKIQLLTHPYSWTEKGYDNLGNFRTLIDEKNVELLHSIDSECQHFSEIKDKL